MLKETLERVSAPMPAYFKKLLKISVTVGAAGAALLGAPAVVAAMGITIALPGILSSIAGYMVAVGAVGASVSKLTIDDNIVKVE